LTSLRRYNEALAIIKLTLKITYKTLPAEKKEKFRSLGARKCTIWISFPLFLGSNALCVEWVLAPLVLG